MKKTILILFFLASTICFSQNVTHKTVTNTFIQNFNNYNFEGIFQSFSEKMQKAKTKEYFHDFFSRIRIENGAILNLEILKYKENKQKTTQGIYDSQNENGELTIKITIDKSGQIVGLYIFKKKIYI
ncbi:DUF3887 domain-containing protein [Flavobacterium terrae]|uniref:DUF3887 domain-containing protein n=1 Tax=Flavobacterium terrae TaxID=415425 RepID=A0A1M6CXY1_9FLAO|nr:DUF3887 domain-containing protein [Flavobacterium terrae]SHI65935.1 Protein of unknown function [Flavobacterium terrae]